MSGWGGMLLEQQLGICKVVPKTCDRNVVSRLTVLTTHTASIDTLKYTVAQLSPGYLLYIGAPRLDCLTQVLARLDELG